jgi:hypothetical protein
MDPRVSANLHLRSNMKMMIQREVDRLCSPPPRRARGGAGLGTLQADGLQEALLLVSGKLSFHSQ